MSSNKEKRRMPFSKFEGNWLLPASITWIPRTTRIMAHCKHSRSSIMHAFKSDLPNIHNEGGMKEQNNSHSKTKVLSSLFSY